MLPDFETFWIKNLYKNLFYHPPPTSSVSFVWLEHFQIKIKEPAEEMDKMEGGWQEGSVAITTQGFSLIIPQTEKNLCTSQICPLTVYFSCPSPQI